MFRFPTINVGSSDEAPGYVWQPCGGFGVKMVGSTEAREKKKAKKKNKMNPGTRIRILVL